MRLILHILRIGLVVLLLSWPGSMYLFADGEEVPGIPFSLDGRSVFLSNIRDHGFLGTSAASPERSIQEASSKKATGKGENGDVPLPASLGRALTVPDRFTDDLGPWRPVLQFEDGRPVRTAEDWQKRRTEILDLWHRIMGSWPPLLAAPKLEVLSCEPRENFLQNRVRIEIAPGQMADGRLLVPEGRGPFPAVLVPFYEPETSIGLGKPGRDFAYQLTRRRFVTLSIGSPGGVARKPELGGATCQPLSYLAYVAANCARALAGRTEVDARRIGIVGHSYGGKWALFAGALSDRFAAVAVSDPGIVWDEARPNVNYWEPWYLGYETGQTRNPGLITAENPRTGAYRRLVEMHHDLHELVALIAPRPFLLSGGAEDPLERWRALNHAVAVNRLLGFSHRVAMTSRPIHDPTPESNEILLVFFEHFLRPTS